MNGNVHITLIGDRGDTGKRRLLRPIRSSSDEKFRPGQVGCVEKLNICAKFRGILFVQL